MITLLAFVFVLGVLVFVHEFGHFFMARLHGVRVHTFSLGFGPKLLKIVRGGTEYCISVVPLGGYVKLAGETVEDAERTGASDEFLSQSRWVRFQVYVMGPVMNLVLAVVITAFVLFMGADVLVYHTSPAVIGTIAQGSPAAAAGLQVGDRIVSINSKTVNTWDDFNMAVGMKADRQVTLGVDRGGRTIEVPLTPKGEGEFDIGDIGVGPAFHPQIAAVTPDMPAAAAGMRAGDVVMGVDGQSGVDQPGLLAYIQKHPGEPVVFHLTRNGQAVDLTITPKKSGDAGIIGAEIYPAQMTRIEPGPLRAIGMSAQQNWDNAKLTVTTLAGLFTGATPVKQLAGPVGIAQLSGEFAREGLLPLLNFMAFISLQLGLLNLLPIPVLDGGHIAILGLEGVARRDFSVRVKERILFAGFAVIVLLLVFVVYNDIARLLTH